MKIIKLNILLYNVLLLNMAVLNGVSQGDSGFWGAPLMNAARRWLSTTQSLPHSTTQQDTGMAEILRDIGETARARIQEQEAELQREQEARDRDSQEAAALTSPQEADQTGEELSEVYAGQNNDQELIRQRDEALRQAEPILRREEPSLVRTIAERYFSRTISLDDLAGPAGPLDDVVSSLTVTGEIEGFERPWWWRTTSEQIQRIGQRFPNLRELVLASIGWGNNGLRLLSEQPFAPNLTSLNIARSNITAEGLNAIGAFTNLTSLDISDNRIGDAGLRILSEQSFAPQLTRLDISEISITLNALPDLNKFTNIRELKIDRNGLSDQALAVLAEQPVARNLTSLTIFHNHITAEGIQHLRSFPQLRELDVSGNNIEDAGLEALAQLPIASQLILLDISSTGITLQGLNSLRAFTALTTLEVRQNKLKDEGLRIIAELPYARNLIRLDARYHNYISSAAAKKYKQVFRSIKAFNVGDWRLM